MIGSLRGVVLDRVAKPGGADVLLEVGGVGYRVTVPAGSFGVIGELGATAFVHVHTHVREDAIVLYGFGSREERVCFEALIGAHGVGPSVALRSVRFRRGWHAEEGRAFSTSVGFPDRRGGRKRCACRRGG